MPIEFLVKHCAPTLAGLKVGNLFNCRFEDANEFKKIVAKRSVFLNQKGVYITILRIGRNSALIYVYRKSQLEKILNSHEIKEFLIKFGYNEFSITKCLSKLKNHLKTEEFPHEIGIFLGYPLHDVKGFIKHKGANCTCCGHWKSYSDEKIARKTFAKYDKCTAVYCKKIQQGFDINRLVVAV